MMFCCDICWQCSRYSSEEQDGRVSIVSRYRLIIARYLLVFTGGQQVSRWTSDRHQSRILLKKDQKPGYPSVCTRPRRLVVMETTIIKRKLVVFSKCVIKEPNSIKLRFLEAHIFQRSKCSASISWSQKSLALCHKYKLKLNKRFFKKGFILKWHLHSPGADISTAQGFSKSLQISLN